MLKSESKSIYTRGARKVRIHGGYRLHRYEAYDDIALIQFDRPFYPKTFTHAKLQPICLPASRDFKDENKRGGGLYGIILH